MNWVVALGAIALFAMLFHAMEIGGAVNRSLLDATSSMKILRDVSLSDEEKEKSLQNQARRLIRGTIAILAKTMVALGVPFALILLLAWLGWIAVSEIVRLLANPLVIAGTFAVAAVYAMILRRRASAQ